MKHAQNGIFKHQDQRLFTVFLALLLSAPLIVVLMSSALLRM